MPVNDWGQNLTRLRQEINPLRWLDPTSAIYKEELHIYTNLKRNSAFKWGRRICPGQPATERAPQVFVNTLVWACDIAKQKDALANQIDIVAYDMTQDSMNPNHFPFSIKPRAQAKIDMLRDAVAEPTIPGFTDKFAVYETFSML